MLCLFLLLLLVIPSLAVVKRNAIDNELEPERLWPTDRPILYTFSANFISFKKRDYISIALESIEERSCLQFLELPILHPALQEPLKWNDIILMFVKLTMGMCRTIVGRSPTFPPDQFGYSYHNIYLVDNKCSPEVGYPHEILHALGIDHTQKRYDRDDYLTYYANRTHPEREKQFEKLTTNNSKTYGVPYDFNSVMHYPEDIDPLTGLPILEPKDELYRDSMGTNLIDIAHSDYLLLNRLYKCLDRCENSTTVCQNGGFVNPRNCEKCICPMAFGGAFCEELPDNSSLPWYYRESWSAEYKNVTGEWTDLEVAVENGKAYRFLHLKAPSGKRVEIEVSSVTPAGNCTNYLSFMEVQLGNFVVGGYKFICGKRLPQKPLFSEGNLVAITLFQEHGDKKFGIKFRSVPQEKNV